MDSRTKEGPSDRERCQVGRDKKSGINYLNDKEDIMERDEMQREGMTGAPCVGIVMGSDSDMPVMAKAADILEELGVPYEMAIISAHREPDVFFEYAKSAEEKGFKVIIAGAGMAAHLAGVLAGNTTLPVIGIPMKGGAADGLDALLATVQMPSGVPVATVALNGAKNAAVLAAQILSLSDDTLADKLAAAKEEMKEQIARKDAKLQEELA